jgi:hypothetical protein
MLTLGVDTAGSHQQEARQRRKGSASALLPLVPPLHRLAGVHLSPLWARAKQFAPLPCFSSSPRLVWLLVRRQIPFGKPLFLCVAVWSTAMFSIDPKRRKAAAKRHLCSDSTFVYPSLNQFKKV